MLLTLYPFTIPKNMCCALCVWVFVFKCFSSFFFFSPISFMHLHIHSFHLIHCYYIALLFVYDGMTTALHLGNHSEKVISCSLCWSNFFSCFSNYLPWIVCESKSKMKFYRKFFTLAIFPFEFDTHTHAHIWITITSCSNLFFIFFSGILFS